MNKTAGVLFLLVLMFLIWLNRTGKLQTIIGLFRNGAPSNQPTTSQPTATIPTSNNPLVNAPNPLSGNITPFGTSSG